MRRTALAATLALLAVPALAQGVTVSPAEGNWGCIALVDNTKAGLLTVFAGSYGYASANFGSEASGTGNAEMGSDGVRFLDGSLAGIGIGYGLVTFAAEGGDVLTLYNPEKPVLVCRPR
ncbi:MAG TPA: hypothetical protein VFE52_05605 [Devosia sp.]|nr:hypothetical protein [Devosia sp.]